MDVFFLESSSHLEMGTCIVDELDLKNKIFTPLLRLLQRHQQKGTKMNTVPGTRNMFVLYFEASTLQNKGPFPVKTGGPICVPGIHMGVSKNSGTVPQNGWWK